MSFGSKSIGVLAVQGSFQEHVNVLKQLNLQDISVMHVKTGKDLDTIDALIIPGGESTSIRTLAKKSDLWQCLKSFIKSGKPVWGTCAGMILLSKSAVDENQDDFLNGLDILIQRNAFGSQVDSFMKNINLEFINGPKLYPAVFIRAPVVESILSEDVDILARVENAGKERIVAVRQGNIFGTAFHPELTNDHRMHQFFCEIVRNSN